MPYVCADAGTSHLLQGCPGLLRSGRYRYISVHAGHGRGIVGRERRAFAARLQRGGECIQRQAL